VLKNEQVVVLVFCSRGIVAPDFYCNVNYGYYHSTFVTKQKYKNLQKKKKVFYISLRGMVQGCAQDSDKQKSPNALASELFCFCIRLVDEFRTLNGEKIKMGVKELGFIVQVFPRNTQCK
jgi:hypothetical protein